MVHCPICLEKFALSPTALERHLDIEPHVIDLICELFPSWIQNDHTSPQALAFYREILARQKQRAA